MAKVDLHIHSNCSDGSDNISELINKIKSSGIEIFALTDHDTIEGCSEMKNIITDNIKFIQGVELTCQADYIKCHILGFGCDIKNKKLLDLIEKGKKLRRIKMETRVEYLKNKWDIELTKEEYAWLCTRKSVVKTHFANILVKRGLAEDNVSAMKKYLDDCKTPNTRFDIKEAIEVLVDAGAIPIWAHPLGGEGEKHFLEEEMLPRLELMKSFGIKGLECYYSRYNKEEINLLKRLAKENSLLISGGSDYHGKNKKNINLAKLNIDNEYVDSKELTVLKEL